MIWIPTISIAIDINIPAITAPHIGDTIISMAIMMLNIPAMIPNTLDPPCMDSASQAMNYSSIPSQNSAIASTNSKNTVEPRGYATTIPATIRTIIPRPIVPHLDDPELD